MTCKYCHINKWFSNRPKPDCRIRYDLENTKNPVTKGVYRDILKHRLEEDAKIECPWAEKRKIHFSENDDIPEEWASVIELGGGDYLREKIDQIILQEILENANKEKT
jgi:hypothetical protein